MPKHHGYPAARPARPTGGPPGAPEKCERYESNGETTLGDTDATVITFAGKPDVITLTARAFSALVTLTDRLSREGDEILVPVGTSLTPRISRERVIARNAVVGSNAILNAVGAWAEAPERA